MIHAALWQLFWSCRSSAVFVLALGVGVASAQSDKPWNGVYAGVNAGGTRNNTCTRSTLNGAMTDAAGGASFSSCAGGGLVGGMQLGADFQTKRLVLGVEADVDVLTAKNASQSLKYAGTVLPPGTYASFGRLNPSDLAVIGPRIGYAGDLLLPYIRAGVVIASGAKDSTVNYTALGATKSVASFSGGKPFNSVGWAAGGGTEIGFNGPWSISVEYLHISLAGNSGSTTYCSGTADACAAFTDISLESTHKSFTTNVLRIGITYWFDYWDL